MSHNIQVPTELIIVKSDPRPFFTLPTKVFLNWCQYSKIKRLMMTGYMVNFFIKHYDLMSPVKENQEVVSTPVKSV